MRHDIIALMAYLAVILVLGIFTILDISSISNVIQHKSIAITLGTIIRITIESIIIIVCIKKSGKYIKRIKGVK